MKTWSGMVSFKLTRYLFETFAFSVNMIKYDGFMYSCCCEDNPAYILSHE